jgi:hypothetical protein
LFISVNSVCQVSVLKKDRCEIKGTNLRYVTPPFSGILPREAEDPGQHGTGHETERIPKQNQVQALKKQDVKSKFCEQTITQIILRHRK